MPEKGMKTLLEQVVDQVARAGRNREFREFAVICDGKDTIWNAAAAHPEFQDAVWILDFYHAAENLMKAAKAIFGDDEVGAARWHKKIRDPLHASISQVAPQGQQGMQSRTQRDQILLLSPRPHVLLRLRFDGATHRQRPG
jgi:hypothetical protein